MAKIDKLPKKITRPIDSYLKFVQQSFNTGGVNFKEILKQLRALGGLSFTSGSMGNIQNDLSGQSQSLLGDSGSFLSPGLTNGQSQSTLSGGSLLSPSITETARMLASQLEDITLLTDLDKYRNFDKLGNFNLESKGLRETYKASNEIIKDIKIARNWLRSYEKFVKANERINSRQVVISEQNTHDELILLGKSILARAIELCPMKTGNLRSSGFMLDMGDHVIIGFSAPYASYVHENLNIVHPIHGGRDCGGRAKFLEVALQEFFPDRQVWTEVLGHQGVMCKIGINPLWLEYNHYG
jgi:hypothetical protein